MNANRKSQGFTLIELMIVVAIIAVVAGISIPNMLRARIAANEVNAIAALRLLVEAESNYRDTFGTKMYGTLNQLSGAVPPYIDRSLATGSVRGYTITMIGAPTADGWAAVAVPDVVGTSGNRGFYVSEEGLIRYTTDGSIPTATDAPLP